MNDLIQRLRDWDNTTPEQNRKSMLEAADALEKQQNEALAYEVTVDNLKAEVARLNHKDKLITKWTENGELIERLYSAGLQQEREIAALKAQAEKMHSALSNYVDAIDNCQCLLNPHNLQGFAKTCVGANNIALELARAAMKESQQ